MYQIIQVFLLMLLCQSSSLARASSVADLFDRVKSAVVVVHTIQHEVAQDSAGTLVSAPSLGSGVLIDKQGHIVTAAHVVHTADRVRVAFIGDVRFDAKVVASDPLQDIALLKIEQIPDKIKPVPLSDSDKVRIGERVFIVGAPYGLDHSLSVGHISSRHKNGVKSNPNIKTELFQTDAAINTGNSGGPMFDMRGRVIGIVSSILSKSGGFEGLGFVVTANAANDALFEQKSAWTGLEGILLSDELARAFNVPQKSGYLVQKIAQGSPAEELGLKEGRIPVKIMGRPLVIGGDIILSVDNVDIDARTPTAIPEYLDSLKPGQEYTVRILRNGFKLGLQGKVK